MNKILKNTSKNFNILVCGNQTHPVNALFQNNLSQYFGKLGLERQPQFYSVKDMNELQQIQDKEFLQNVNMISLMEFGSDQTEVMTNVYQNNKQNVEIIHGFLVGVDKFLPQILGKVDENVIIANAKGSFSPSLGEFVVFSCLYHAKRVPLFQKVQAQNKWIREPVNMLQNKTILICGYGDIGTTVAKYCKNIGLKVVGIKNDPNSATEEQKQYAERIVGLDQLDSELSQADYVVNALPLTPQTDKLFDISKFRKMKPSAIFANIGRGQSVVEDDVVTAINEKAIAGATLDVFNVEPLDSKSPLWNLENVFITQHCGDYTTDYWELTYQTFQDNLEIYLKGGQMKNIVDRKKGY